MRSSQRVRGSRSAGLPGFQKPFGGNVTKILLPVSSSIGRGRRLRGRVQSEFQSGKNRLTDRRSDRYFGWSARDTRICDLGK